MSFAQEQPQLTQERYRQSDIVPRLMRWFLCDCTVRSLKYSGCRDFAHTQRAGNTPVFGFGSRLATGFPNLVSACFEQAHIHFFEGIEHSKRHLFRRIALRQRAGHVRDLRMAIQQKMASMSMTPELHDEDMERLREAGIITRTASVVCQYFAGLFQCQAKRCYLPHS